MLRGCDMMISWRGIVLYCGVVYIVLYCIVCARVLYCIILYCIIFHCKRKGVVLLPGAVRSHHACRSLILFATRSSVMPSL